MLVTFHCPVYPDIVMFGDVAQRLLELMGHSGTVPGALAADDVPVALARLRRALEEHGEEPAEELPPEERERDPQRRPVRLSQRAFPLLELLEAAAAAGKPVSWR